MIGDVALAGESLSIFARLDWVGLGWIGLDWIGLDWWLIPSERVNEWRYYGQFFFVFCMCCEGWCSTFFFVEMVDQVRLEVCARKALNMID